MKESLEINKEYLEKESANPERSVYWITSKGESVKQWILNYCRRNKIEIKENSESFFLYFKSARQGNMFLYKGMELFPYYEFY